MQELGEEILMSRARSDFRSVGGSILPLTLVTVAKPKNTHTHTTHPPFPPPCLDEKCTRLQTLNKSPFTIYISE